MAVTPTNRARWRAVLVSREVKWVLCALPSIVRAGLAGLLWRWMFNAADGHPHRAGEIVLADLRAFCRADGDLLFSNDPLVMARRVGRREVFDRIANYLHLDEHAVQKLMEVDDGLGE